MVTSQRLAQQQQAYEKQLETRAHIQKYIDRFKAQATKARQAQSRIKQLERMQLLAPAHVDTPFTFSFREPTKMSSPLLTLEQADIGYGDKLIATNINIQITPTSRIGLLGMNGAGKSTLIKSLVGDLPLLAGQRKASELLNIGYFAQHQMDSLDESASPMLQLARIADKKISEATLRAFLGSFGFSGERMDTPCESFSGGERARLALALIVWLRPNVWHNNNKPMKSSSKHGHIFKNILIALKPKPLKRVRHKAELNNWNGCSCLLLHMSIPHLPLASVNPPK